jgi:DNA phosphorothioation-dependent restriction protein DptH
MLQKAHLTSDWVFTIDRNFGIEYYDDPTAGPAGESGGYLIDYTPEFLDAISHRLIISTYHQHELESILKCGFSKLLETDDREAPAIDSYQVGRILQVLKSVSGKLALKLINNPSQVQEVIGLALTRLHLEREGVERCRADPGDSHIQLFHQTPKELQNSKLTLERTDLILARFEDMQLHLDLIEVKN